MSSILKVDSITDVNGNAIISSDGSGNLTANTLTGLTVAGNVSIDGGTIKLDGNYPDGLYNIGFGNLALSSLTTGEGNVGIGHTALRYITTADSNTAVGQNSLRNNTASDNTAVGYLALTANTTGTPNTALGGFALQDNTTGNDNTAVGYGALADNTTASNNTALGREALRLNVTGASNTALGRSALYNNTASNNTAVGYQALTANTTGQGQVAIGYQSLDTCTTGTNNTSVGNQSLESITTGSNNTAIGNIAGRFLTTGIENTFVGNDSGSAITTGSKNVILGEYNGNSGGLDIRTSSNNIVLSDGDGNVRQYIDSSGVSYFGTTNGSPADANVVGTVIRYDSSQKALSVTGDGNTPAVFNLKGTDGNVVNINQDGTTEGAISVSGTTVTFVGGHLGRWSQLTTNTRDESIVKGTVMSNLDDMCVWGDEDNEQLNKMKVSDTEGDDNVAGVFVSWDDFDEVYTNDMNIAMTGDMVIRIAQGVTVTKGQLLMSAGDGTAKPQGDDIVRSKTIAKVTSNNVTKTYDDGSYLVPCVLMAC